MHSAPSVRLTLDALGAQVVAHVAERTPGRMTVRRALPFLKLHSAVHDESGHRAEVAGVRVVIEDGMPQLVLELDYTRGADSPSERRKRDATVPYTTDTGKQAPVLDTNRALTREHESTLLFVTQRTQLGEGELALRVERPSLFSRLASWFTLLFAGRARA